MKRAQIGQIARLIHSDSRVDVGDFLAAYFSWKLFLHSLCPEACDPLA